jgi:hypothetical protein
VLQLDQKPAFARAESEALWAEAKGSRAGALFEASREGAKARVCGPPTAGRAAKAGPVVACESAPE